MFFGFFVLFFVALLMSSFVFYTYVFSVGGKEIQTGSAQAYFEKQVFENIVETWEVREIEFNAAGKNQIRNIFSPVFQAEQQEDLEEADS